MLFSGKGLLAIPLCLSFASVISAQVGSITLREITITPEGERFRSFAGKSQTFTPGADNTLVVNAPVDSRHRTAKVSAKVDYSFDLQRQTTGGAILSCQFTIPQFPDEPGRAFAIRVDNGSSAGSASAFVADGEMILDETPDQQYTFSCRISDPADFNVLAQAPLVVQQSYEFLDAIRILQSSPPTFAPLVAGSTQSFTANVEYTRDVIRLGGLATLVATGSDGRELVARSDRRTNASSETVSGDGPNPVQIQLTLPDVPIPEDGFVALHAELVNGRQFAAWEPYSYQTYVQSEPVHYGEPSEIDYSILHIETNQAVQDDENLIPMVADKPGVVRVYVHSPVRPDPGEATAVPVTVKLRRDGQERTFSSSALLITGSKDDRLFPIRDIAVTSATVAIPLEMTRPGELEIEVAANLVNGEAVLPETNTANNTRIDTVQFFERDTLALGWTSLGVTTEPDPTATIRKLFPLSPTRGLAYFQASASELRPGETQEEADARAVLEASIMAMSGLADVVVLWFTDERGEGAVRFYALATALLSNAPLVPIEVTNGARNADRLAAKVADRLLGSKTDSSVCDSADAGGPDGVGWDSSEARLVRLALHKEVMRGCAGKGSMWVSPSRYARLFLRDFRQQPAGLREEAVAQQTLELAAVSGEVRADGGGSLSPVVRFSGGQAPPMEDAGEYCVEVSGPGGSARHCFTPQFGGADTLPFSVIFPADMTTSLVRLTRNGSEVASMAASTTAPMVAITSPPADAVIDAGPPLTVSWNASDVDGDAIHSTIFVSGDGGATWSPIATNVQSGSYEVDSTRLPAGEQVMFRVVASDGLLTATAEAGPLTIRQAPAGEVQSSFPLGESAAGVPVSALLPIESTGTGPLRILSAQTDNPAFAVASSLPYELWPGTPGGLAIEATPPSAGQQTATLTLETNVGSPIVVQLSASGLDPEQPILDISAPDPSLSFGEATVGETNETTVSLVNRGRIPLAYQAAVEGEGFSLSGEAESTLQANEQQDLLIRFTPASAGTFAGALHITSDAPNASSTQIALSGEGVAAPATPQINAGGVVDAASFQAKLTRGGIGSLFGVGLAATVEAASSLPLPTSLAGVQVLVDGVPAPLFFVSPNQINFQTPYEAPREGMVAVSVRTSTDQSSPVSVTVAPNAPALFANPATGEPIITRADNSLVTASRPAGPGDVLVVFLTGVGDLDNVPASGAAAGVAPCRGRTSLQR
ncbi:MAG: choice-of-anchor D domain-containing protein [Bryobacterales bacterium]